MKFRLDKASILWRVYVLIILATHSLHATTPNLTNLSSLNITIHSETINLEGQPIESDYFFQVYAGLDAEVTTIEPAGDLFQVQGESETIPVLIPVATSCEIIYVQIRCWPADAENVVWTSPVAQVEAGSGWDVHCHTFPPFNLAMGGNFERLETFLREDENDSTQTMDYGKAAFVLESAIPTLRPSAFALGDLDGDLDLDLFTANAESCGVWINDGAGDFEQTEQALGEGLSGSVQLADLDNDGDLDAWVSGTLAGDGNESTEAPLNAHEVWLNRGNGRFDGNGRLITGTGGGSPSIADLDGDGDWDVFGPKGWSFAPNPDGHVIYFNHGDGGFDDLTDSGIETPGELDYSAFTSAIGDFNLDGKPDIALHSGYSTTQVAINSGNANFHLSSQDLNIRRAQLSNFGGTPLIADFNNDLLPDIFLPVENNYSSLWQNNGNAFFIPKHINFIRGGLSAAEDFDVDGDLDLVLLSGSYGGESRLWMNNGRGYFNQSLPISSSNHFDLKTGDIDGDGRPEMLISNSDKIEIWRLEVGFVYSEDHVHFEDYWLKKTLTNELDENNDDRLSASEIKSASSLNLSRIERYDRSHLISSLKGLEHAESLEELDLSGLYIDSWGDPGVSIVKPNTNVRDYSVLEPLKSLSTLKLSYNKIEGNVVLPANMRNLKRLELAGNAVDTISFSDGSDVRLDSHFVGAFIDIDSFEAVDEQSFRFRVYNGNGEAKVYKSLDLSHWELMDEISNPEAFSSVEISSNVPSGMRSAFFKVEHEH